MPRKPHPKLAWVTDRLARLVDVTCSCGGPVYVDDIGTRQYRYEAYCADCKCCDPNGWPSLTAVLANSPQYFNPGPGLALHCRGDTHG